MYSIFEFKENKHNIRIKSCLETEKVRTVVCGRKSRRHPDEKLWVVLPDSLRLEHYQIMETKGSSL